VRVDTALLFARSPQVFLRRRAYILVLSHMRSYSSLLCHILGSHVEISGYAEMHVTYRGALDLMRMRARVARSLGGELSGRYVLDKVLHNEYAISEAVIRRPDVFPIFLLRRPLPSIGSILELGRDMPEVPWYSDIAAITDYYVARVQKLAELAQQAGSRYLFVKAEEILDERGRALERVGTFLRLVRPLHESYSIFPRTGQVGYGDSSPQIMAGRIVRDRPPKAAPGALTKSEAARVVQAYKTACSLLEGGGSR
jgi:hypothetical protein